MGGVVLLVSERYKILCLTARILSRSRAVRRRGVRIPRSLAADLDLVGFTLASSKPAWLPWDDLSAMARWGSFPSQPRSLYGVWVANIRQLSEEGYSVVIDVGVDCRDTLGDGARIDLLR